MAHRSAIARKNEGTGFEGVFHQYCSHPHRLGARLFQMRRSHFNADTGEMLRFIIDEHPAGWCDLTAGDLDKPAGFRGEGPECYCCGKRNNPPEVACAENVLGDTDIEYLYLFEEGTPGIMIIMHQTEEGTRIVTVNLNEEEPCWERLPL